MRNYTRPKRPVLKRDHIKMDKAAFRDYCLSRLKSSTKHNKRYKEALLESMLYALIKEAKASQILLYWPLPFEADLRRLTRRIRRRAEVYIPFMEGDSFKMVPLRLPLERKRFGIYEAGNTYRKIKNIDIAVVPAVGVDADARRIGFGKGMYDRFFSTLKERPTIYFVQLEPCLSQRDICDDFDISADVLVTPTVCYSKMGTEHVKRNTLRRGHCHAKRSSRFSHL